MSLAACNRSSFLAADRRRGQHYYDGGRVRLGRCGARLIRAEVMGSVGIPYTVELRVDGPAGDDLDVSCDCPRFANGYLCKHVWATMLAADDQRHPQGQGGTRPPSWGQGMADLEEAVARSRGNINREVVQQLVTQKPIRCWFAISLSESVSDGFLNLIPYISELNAPDEWSIPRACPLSEIPVSRLVEPGDREVLRLLQGWDNAIDDHARFDRYEWDVACLIPDAVQSEVLTQLDASGRFVWTLDQSADLRDSQPLSWDPGPEWRIVVSVRLPETGETEAVVSARLQRPGEEAELTSLVMAFSEGLVLFTDRLCRLSPTEAGWVAGFLQSGPLHVPTQDLDRFLDTACQLPVVPQIEFDPVLEVTVATGQPQGRLVLSRPTSTYGHGSYLNAEIWFRYEDQQVTPHEDRSAFWVPDQRRVIRRDHDAECELLSSLSTRGFESPGMYGHGFGYGGDDMIRLEAVRLPEVVARLADQGWEVIADDRAIRHGGEFRAHVKSNLDWFDVDLEAEIDGMAVSLPTLLAAVRQKQRFVVLDDGSQGVLPQEWLDRLGRLAEFVDEDDPTPRFHRCQALLLDSLLADNCQVSLDRDFTRLCQKMRDFEGVRPVKTTRGFRGELRPYQEEGLAWFGFLRDFQFGGCLADDMGLGKTVQVLALLESRRTRRRKAEEARRPSLVVAPKSLVFNWMNEARRFAPKLRILNHTGLERDRNGDGLLGVDVVLTTYGTLRRDIEMLSEAEYDYVILDEAQAIKNAASQTAKACRLIRAHHRLAMTGTPVENHLGELGSLLEFLNPGMIGQSHALKQAFKASNPDPESLELLRASLRPFILRRTKQQVLADLPEKTEQSIYCEMTPKQQKLYRELRDYYRLQISKKVERLGIRRSKIHVLEALLRLRQAACDPRLLDDQQAIGAKLQLLLERLEEVLDEGHKALVFSQFTSLLALVRQHVEERGWDYEYLDGKTRKRAECVARFQDDEACQLFLISLKAGGQGLNLTAADYVFILDPWWNPAVEAQAIDRAHRIGQTQQVMAYRIICRDTVEEKIVELQTTKRELADAIITANESLISRLTTDDLELLFT